jgi:hypothetical protein
MRSAAAWTCLDTAVTCAAWLSAQTTCRYVCVPAAVVVRLSGCLWWCLSCGGGSAQPLRQPGWGAGWKKRAAYLDSHTPDSLPSSDILLLCA